jgi:hypothetical protein
MNGGLFPTTMNECPPPVRVAALLLRYMRRLERDVGEGDSGDPRHLPGDCREVLATLPADSVDAVVTDPPYELAFYRLSHEAACPLP